MIEPAKVGNTDRAGRGKLPDDRAQISEMDTQLIPDLERLQSQALPIHPADPACAALHQQFIDLLQLTIVSCCFVAVSLADNDAASLADARAQLAAASAAASMCRTSTATQVCRTRIESARKRRS